MVPVLLQVKQEKRKASWETWVLRASLQYKV